MCIGRHRTEEPTRGDHAIHRRHARFRGRGPVRPRAEHPLAVRCRTDWSRGVPTSYARKLADYWADDSTGAPRRRGSTRSRSSRPTSTASRSTSSMSGRRFPARRRSWSSTATRARSSSSLRMIGPLVDPEAHGGRAGGRFSRGRAVAPGFGFSTPVTPRAGRSRSPPRRSIGSCRRSGTSGTASTAATSAPGSSEQICIQAGDRVIGSLTVTDPGAIATEYTPPTDHLTEAEQQRLEGAEGGPCRGLRLPRDPDDATAVDRVRADRFARRSAHVDRREDQGVDGPDPGAAGGRRRPRPAAHPRERLLVWAGRRRRGELPVRGRPRRGRLGRRRTIVPRGSSPSARSR